MNPEFSGLVVTGGKHSAPIARAADADRLSFQGRLVANLDGGVERIHVEMDDLAPFVRKTHNRYFRSRSGAFQTAVFWGTHAPRVLAMAPSPSRTCSAFVRKTSFRRGAETSTRGACAPR